VTSLFLVVIISGCASTASTQIQDDWATEFASLVEGAKYKEAADKYKESTDRYINEEENIIVNNKRINRRLKKSYKQLAVGLGIYYKPITKEEVTALHKMTFNPIDSTSWSTVTKELQDAERLLSLLSSYKSIAAFKKFDNEIQPLVDLQKELSKAIWTQKEQLAQHSSQAFSQYPPDRLLYFFDDYPVELDRRLVLAENVDSLDQKLSSHSSEEIILLTESWSQNKAPSAAIGVIASNIISNHLFFTAWDELEETSEQNVNGLINTYKRVFDAGLTASSSLNDIITYNLDENDRKKSEFPVRFSSFGKAIHSSDLHKNPQQGSQKIQVTIAATNTHLREKTVDTSIAKSRYIVGHQEIQNPNYQAALVEYNLAQSKFQSAQSAYNANRKYKPPLFEQPIHSNR